ncbi:helix-turn-helix domain-containing protein [Streptomyces violaceusniger]|uniref:helix-turn-helix domain-containing protein n=1 Tax=Streptomyces violaceusniger TaxID=68280 RepID=UPI003816A47A
MAYTSEERAQGLYQRRPIGDDGLPSAVLPEMYSRTTAGPQAAAMILGERLRELRVERAITMTSAANAIGCSVSLLSRLERAASQPSLKHVRNLAKYYDVTSEEAESLASLVSQALAPKWWHAYNEVVPDWWIRLVGLESAATCVRLYEMRSVPGLLQTKEYARAVKKAGGVSEVPEGLLDFQAARQERFFGGSIQSTFLLDEGVLYRTFGGFEVMASQMQHLIQEFDNPNLRIRIVPFSAKIGSPVASLTHILFAGLPDVAIVESVDSAVFISEEPSGKYKYLMDRLIYDSSSRSDSLEMLKVAKKRFASEISV